MWVELPRHPATFDSLIRSYFGSDATDATAEAGARGRCTRPGSEIPRATRLVHWDCERPRRGELPSREPVQRALTHANRGRARDRRQDRAASGTPLTTPGISAGRTLYSRRCRWSGLRTSMTWASSARSRWTSAFEEPTSSASCNRSAGSLFRGQRRREILRRCRRDVRGAHTGPA